MGTIMAHKSSPAIHEGRRGLGNIESQLEALSGHWLVGDEVTKRVHCTCRDIATDLGKTKAVYAITYIIWLFLVIAYKCIPYRECIRVSGILRGWGLNPEIRRWLADATILTCTINSHTHTELQENLHQTAARRTAIRCGKHLELRAYLTPSSHGGQGKLKPAYPHGRLTYLDSDYLRAPACNHDSTNTRACHLDTTQHTTRQCGLDGMVAGVKNQLATLVDQEELGSSCLFRPQPPKESGRRRLWRYWSEPPG